MSSHTLTKVGLWIRALTVLVTSLPCPSHTYTHKRIHNLIAASLYTRLFCWWSPNRQKAPYRHAEHKPNADPSRDDLYIISKGSVDNCRKRCILKKSLLTTFINKQINKQDCPRTMTQLIKGQKLAILIALSILSLIESSMASSITPSVTYSIASSIGSSKASTKAQSIVSSIALSIALPTVLSTVSSIMSSEVSSKHCQRRRQYCWH